MDSFNPYRVFEYVATPDFGIVLCAVVKFQSLSGFRVRCNKCFECGWVQEFKFQSLSGFRVRCNGRYRFCSEFDPSVSIPIGFSSTLQPNFRIITRDCTRGFQSLSGFRVRCNGRAWTRTCSTTKFQSLSGFRVRCNRITPDRPKVELGSFNPYRVFEYVATSSARTAYFTGTTFQSLSGFRVRCNLAASCCRCSERVVFQSLSGFRVRCNFMISLRPMEIYFVSIPIGFSSTLQREKLSGQVNWLTQFQSLSGFRVRCNHFSFLNVVLVLKVSIPIGFSSTLQRHH